MTNNDDHLGTIKVFLPAPKNFGFVIADNPSLADIFFHQSALAYGTDETRLIRGARCRFTLAPPSPKGQRASAVELI